MDRKYFIAREPLQKAENKSDRKRSTRKEVCVENTVWKRRNLLQGLDQAPAVLIVRQYNTGTNQVTLRDLAR